MNDYTHQFPQIPGYCIVKKIYEGSKTQVYQGIREADQKLITLKLLKTDYPSFRDLVQFRNQYTITKSLKIPGIVCPLSLEPYRNGYALIMEDCGSISLRDYAQHQPLGLINVLKIALQLSDILHHLHSARIIHKDIKPANILIHPDTQQVKLIDFSIASLLPKETQEIQNPKDLEGTLAYLAPEQTGRMNRAIDYRSDFYSLGITLYELFTGRLPFASTAPLELVHSHLTETPIPPHQLNAEIPLVVSNLILKLMAKNSENRYQNALGLKHDLEQCIQQWQETRNIVEFELGQRDLCDRFVIPERLYGREAEVQTLLDAFERVANGTMEMMLVAGFSGIGKTAVVNEVHKPITRQQGYFIKGKFDQFNRNIPLSAFVQALRDLMGQLLSESDAQLAQWQARILEAVGENGQILIDVIPELEKIIGKQLPAPELSGTAAQNRFNLLFQKFIAVFTTSEHPLVMFLDDLQWSDLASLRLIKLLMEDQNYLLLLGAYRDNEVQAAHPLSLTVEELKKAGKTIHSITLAPLAFQDINQWVADTLHCKPERSHPLTELINRQTQGNPFFTSQFLKAFYENGQIQFNRNQGYWECDLAEVNALSLTDDVVEFMAQQLQKLPSSTQEVLKLAACIGNQFDLQTLAIVSEQSQTLTATALWKALQEGLILPTSQTYKFFQAESQESLNCQGSVSNQSIHLTYRFLHDRVQQAAYKLIPEELKQAIHLAIGQLLHASTCKTELESNIFAIVNHLNQGVDLMTQPNQRRELAQLNLIAGRKAKAAIAYHAAVNYFSQGIDLLPPNAWTVDYEITLTLHQERLEATCLNTDFDKLADWSEIVLQSATSLLDTIKVYEIQIMAFRAQGQCREAIETGLTVLKLLGVEFPKQPSREDVHIAAEKTQKLWQNDTPLRLLDLPVMSDPYQLATLQILTKLVPCSYIAAPLLLPLLIFKQVELSIRFGNAPVSVFSFADYGLILCGFIGNLDAGYEFGKLSLKLLEKLQVTVFKSRAYFIFNCYIRHWKEPLHQSIPFLLEGYQNGLETGDWESVALNAMAYSQYSYCKGRELSDLADEMAAYQQAISQIKQESTLKYHECYQQAVLNLLGKSEVPYVLQGTVLNVTEVLPHLQALNDQAGIFHVALNQAILYYLFGQFEQALQQATLVEQYTHAGVGYFMVVVGIFYVSLIHLAQYAKVSSEQQSSILEKVNTSQAILQNWANHAPFNHQHRWQLVEAERYRILGQRSEAIDYYDLAIVGAKTQGYVQEEALANELAVQFYLDWGKEKLAEAYLQEAYYGYARWGAIAKTNDLEKRYPQLLQSILHRPSNLIPLETISKQIILPSTLSSSSNNTSICSVLDFASILKASQALSSEIQLEKLLSTLMQVVIENAGAKKAALLRFKENTLLLEVIATSQEDVTLPSIPYQTSVDIPLSIINNVKRSLKTVVLDDAITQNDFIADPYFLEQKPRSVLCTPILNQGQLIGLLYLENQLTIGAFTPERLEVIQLLCTQAAISLENARLYQQSQQALQDLQKAQLQIVQSEKMSALGNLIAGVAHEMNNPLGFIAATLQQSQPIFADIAEHLKLYQQSLPNPSEEILNHAEEIDLDYSLEDLPKMIDSMLMACDRLNHISTSLRTFSRVDKDYKVPFNIHEGIDSTLLILKHRLKANEQRPAIEVITEYGSLPPIQCFPGQLNQVFMNLLANAIDALEESNIGRDFREIQNDPNQIRIRTLGENEQIKVVIADNGKGIDQKFIPHIFDQFFTTKTVGKGTGLGLAIVRQIVTEKHDGIIACSSELGKGTQFTLTLPLA